MNNIERLYDQIEAYLKGQLSEREHAEFENELYNNPDLKGEVEVHKKALEVLKFGVAADISQMIDEKATEYTPTNNSKWVLLGGSIICIVGVVLYLIAVGNNDTFSRRTEKSFVEGSSKEKGDEQKKIILRDGKERKTETVLTDDKTITQIAEKQKSGAVLSLDTNNNTENEEQVVKNNDEESLLKKSTDTYIEDQQKETINTEEQVEDECLSIPKIRYDIVPEHLGEKDGKVTLFNIEGKKLSYQLVPATDVYVNTRIYDNLESGMYQIKVREGECEYDMDIIDVPATYCAKEKDYTFNLTTEEKWQIPLPTLDGTVSIVNKSGQNMYNKTFIASDKLSWNGSGSNGEADAGLHKVIVKTRKETCVYNVVIAK